MRPGDRAEAERLELQLNRYEADIDPLPGIKNSSHRTSFVEQLLESERRRRYVKLLLTRELGPLSGDPGSAAFDPLKAAIISARQGNQEEAFWLIFLFVHFGRHRRAGWKYAREVYGRLGQGGLWDWPAVRGDVSGFRTWLDANVAQIKGTGKARGFGNHRKYESLAGWTANGTGAAVASYVDWIDTSGGHRKKIRAAIKAANGNRSVAFDTLFRSMSAVQRFGRTARFDYLSMLDKTELAEIRPGKTYMAGSTGPQRGARLLLDAPNNADTATLEAALQTLERYLSVGFDVLEDALCNWQKSPETFKPFRG